MRSRLPAAIPWNAKDLYSDLDDQILASHASKKRLCSPDLTRPRLLDYHPADLIPHLDGIGITHDNQYLVRYGLLHTASHLLRR